MQSLGARAPLSRKNGGSKTSNRTELWEREIFYIQQRIKLQTVKINFSNSNAIPLHG